MANAQKTLTSVPQKKVAVASKKTMNLAFHESSINPKTLVPTVAVIVIAAAVFLKFGFLDQNAKKMDALAQLSAKQEQLAAYTAKLQEYDALASEYGRFSYGWMTEQEAGMVDRMQILSIIENIIDPDAAVVTFAINNNVINANISGLSLNQTSELVNKLEENSLVTNVTVYNAKSEDADLNASVSMTIVLAKEAE